MMAEPGSPTALSPRAQVVARRIDCVVLWFATHWLSVFIAYGSLVVGLAMLAPLLEANGNTSAAHLIYLPFRLICHQRDDRSFHLHGEQLAFCQRDVSIVSAAVLMSLVFAVLSRWQQLPQIGFIAVVIFALPMAIDGGTQLVGLRTSTPELRVVTGALFSIGAGWFVLPHLEAGFASMRHEIHRRRGSLNSGTVNAP